jgi:hypothetical protein
MTYRLTIVKVERNPAYDADKNKVAMTYPDYGPIQPQEIETRHLETTLNEEEFTSIKHALLEIWK